MKAKDLGRTVDALTEVKFKRLAAFDRGEVGVFWAASGVSPGERHPENEELISVIEGSFRVEVRTDEGSDGVPVQAGQVIAVAPQPLASPPS